MGRLRTCTVVLLAGVASCPAAGAAAPARVVIESSGGDAYTLLVDGEPFYVRGMTFSKPREGESLDVAMRDIVSLGANTVRTWGCDENWGIRTPELLDAAHRHGLKVILGLWLYHSRPSDDSGDTFNWFSEGDRNKLFAERMRSVERHKDHPALLMWGVGNEVILHMRSDEEKRAYCEFVERMCDSIGRVDTNHPTTSASAHSISWKYWAKYCPSLGIYGSNSYGPSIQYLSGIMSGLKLGKPYLVTEIGPRGSWDAPRDANGMKIEPSDDEKYAAVAQGFKRWVVPRRNCLGACVFNYTDGLSGAHVWLTAHVSGLRRPAYWAAREAFTGRPPANAPPTVGKLELAPDAAASGQWVTVRIDARDAEADDMEVSFHYYEDLGNFWKKGSVRPVESVGDLRRGFAVKVPEARGVRKVYAFVKDASGNLSIAQTSLVIGTGPAPEAHSEPPAHLLVRRAERARPEPKPFAPPVVSAPPKPSDEAMAMFSDLLTKRAIEAVAEGVRVTFHFSMARQRVLVRAADEAGLDMRGIATPITMRVAWERLNGQDHKSLALALVREGVGADHALAAFFLKTAGDTDAAGDHLARSGEYAMLVRDAFGD